MALTGGRIAATIYNINGNDLPFGTANNGRLNNFPNVGVLFYATPPGTLSAGVTMNAVIEVLPTGLRTSSNKYQTDSTVATLLSAGT